VKNYLEQVFGLFGWNTYEREVEEELQFHIEMQAQEYERLGLTSEESFARAALRFGDFAQIKKQCIRIGKQNNISIWAMKILFTMAFFLGVLLRALNPEAHVTQVGNVLIMIGVFGGLLLYGKTSGRAAFGPKGKSVRLGLDKGSDSIPLGVDEKGRTPFERVAADDR